MAQPVDRFYTHTHEWVKVEGDTATVGITQYAQEQLGDVVFVEVPAAGKPVSRETAMGTIESVKAVSEVFAPVSVSTTVSPYGSLDELTVMAMVSMAMDDALASRSTNWIGSVSEQPTAARGRLIVPA